MNIVLSGPSGTGKGTLTEMLLKNPEFKKFTTCTTRKPRDGEKNGFDYYFLDEEKFLNLEKCLMLGNMVEIIMEVLKEIWITSYQVKI